MSGSATALVLGATGGIGGEVARLMLARGWRVRALHRHPEKVASTLPGLDWRRGDALDADSVRAAAEGVGVILHGVNPPGYRRWAELVLPMIDSRSSLVRSGEWRRTGPETDSSRSRASCWIRCGGAPG